MTRIGKRIKKLFVWALLLVVLALVYRHNPYQVEFLGHYNKIWAHRVNSTQKLNLAEPFFNGVELDLVYMPESGVLDVTHPPAESIGLALKDYLAQVNHPESLKLWFDIKNLEQQYASAILARVNTIVSSYGIPAEHIIIESRFPEALGIFAAFGYKTSYYLPQRISELTGKTQYKTLLKIENTLKANPSLAVSTHFTDYNLLAEVLPKTTKYIWTNGYSRFNDYKALRTILEDPSVEVVLIRYKALKGNR